MKHNNSLNDDLEALSKRKIEEYAGAIAFNLLVIVFGIIGNTMSIVFYGFKVPRTSTNVMITGLATIDLIACVSFSDKIIELCLTVTFKNILGCKLMYFLNHWLAITSGYMLLFVAIDRYRKICRPFTWQFSIKSVIISLLIIVIAAMAYSVRHLVTIDVVHVNVTETKSEKTIEAFYCTHSKNPGLKTAITVFHYLDLLAFIIVIGGCIVLYILISRALWVSSKQIKHTYKAKRNSADGQQDGASTRTWYTGASSTVETTFNDTHIGNIKYDEVESTTQPSCVLSNPDKIRFEKFDLNADPGNILSGDNAAVKGMDTRLKIKKYGKNKPNVADNAFKFKTFKRDNDPKQDTIYLSKRIKQYHAKKKVTLMMIVISIASMVSFLPYFIVNITIKQKASVSEQEFSVGIQIALRSFILNNAINPYVIGLFNSKFRQFVYGFVCKCIRFY